MKFIETTNEGVHCYNRFSADFSDDIVKLNNRNYPLGAVSKMVANISKEEMDVLLQLGGKALNCYKTISLLGYNRNVFLIHKGVILDMLSYMKNFEIFQCFDYEGSKKLVDDLLSEEALDKYEDYLDDDKPLTEERALKLKVIKKRYDYAIVLGLIYAYIGIDTANFATAVQKDIKKRYDYAIVLGLIYAYIGIDTANFATAVQNFTVMLMEKTSRQKSELAKTAFELFNDELFMYYLYQSNPAVESMWGFSVKSMNTVVPVIDEVNGEYKILRRVYFSRMMDFYVMDLFEALSHGHYLWQCGICGKYFLMTTAHRQLYCEEKNPKYDVPCKYVAKHPELTEEKKESQKKSDTPIRVLWKKRDDAIRKRKSRHKYSDAEFEAAKEYIMDCYERAQTDFDYAAEQYEKDMELTAVDEYVRRVTDV